MQSIFRVIFINKEEVYEVYAKSVTESEMFSFVEIEALVFGETSGLLVDPVQEKLKTEFSGVKRFYVPMHAVIRIDEVEKEGIAKITEVGEKGSNVSRLPTAFMQRPGDGKDAS